MVGRVSVPLVLGCRYRYQGDFTVPVLLSANIDSRTGLGTDINTQYRIWFFVTDVGTVLYANCVFFCLFN